MNKFILLFSSFKPYHLLLLIPAIFMAMWHIYDNSLPTGDGSQFFFKSVAFYENLFLEKYNIFESSFRYIKDIIYNRGIKPSLFPAIGSLVLIPSFGNWNVAFALMGIFYITLTTIFAYLIIFEFTRKKYYSALAAIIIGTIPAVFSNAITNYAEIGLVAFLLPTFYYLYKSNNFSVANYSKYFAVFLTLAISVRPIQALLILLLPILITLWRGKIKNIFSSKQLLSIAYLSILFLCILMYIPYLRTFGEPLYFHLTKIGFPSYNLSVVTDMYLKLTITMTSLFAIFSAVLLYKKRFNYLRKELSIKFQNHSSYIMQVFLLIFILNIIIWAFLFHNFFYWVFAASFGSFFPAGQWNLASANSSENFTALLLGGINNNAFYAFYFTLISLFFLSLLNRSIPTFKAFIFIFASALIFPLFTLLSSQTDSIRFVPTVTICLIIFLILLGSFKKFSRLPVLLLLSFVLFKSFVFFDYSLNFKFVNQDFYNFAQNKYTGFPRGFVQERAEPIQDSEFYTLDVLIKYHQKYNFKRVYVDGNSKLIGKYGVDQFKVNHLSRFKKTPFSVGDVHVEKHNNNSYKMIANQGYDFMFLTNPLIHDDGSQKYKDEILYRSNCFSVTAPCNISQGSLESFRMILNVVRKINDGTISETKWELVETIKHYNYDVFVLKLQNRVYEDEK